MYPDRCFVVGRMLFYTSSAVHQISLIPIPREIQNEKGEFVLKDKMTIGVADKQLLLAANYLVGLLSRAGVSRSSSIRCLPNGEPGVRLTHMTAVVCKWPKAKTIQPSRFRSPNCGVFGEIRCTVVSIPRKT
mgnify:FL=1